MKREATKSMWTIICIAIVAFLIFIIALRLTGYLGRKWTPSVGLVAKLSGDNYIVTIAVVTEYIAWSDVYAKVLDKNRKIADVVIRAFDIDGDPSGIIGPATPGGGQVNGLKEGQYFVFPYDKSYKNGEFVLYTNTQKVGYVNLP
jgi:hypothetical protein